MNQKLRKSGIMPLVNMGRSSSALIFTLSVTIFLISLYATLHSWKQFGTLDVGKEQLQESYKLMPAPPEVLDMWQDIAIREVGALSMILLLAFWMIGALIIPACQKESEKTTSQKQPESTIRKSTLDSSPSRAELLADCLGTIKINSGKDMKPQKDKRAKKSSGRKRLLELHKSSLN